MIKSTAEMLKKGYLLFPKVLFEEQMKKDKRCDRILRRLHPRANSRQLQHNRMYCETLHF